jgi:uncharacterized membrane protein
MRRPDGELLLLWTLPALGLIWASAFLLFPGFLHPMPPTMSGAEVAAFYSDSLGRIRFSMIVFNWFCVGLIPVLMLLAQQVRRMAHRTPIFSNCMIGCAAGGPTIFLMANLFWILAAYRPDRAPELTRMFNDLAWITFTTAVPFLIAQSVLMAVAIYWDRQERPVFPRWVAHFNLVVAVALTPAAFTGLVQEGPVAWNGVLSFWVKNFAIAVWIIVTGVVLAKAIDRQRAEESVAA